MAVTSRGPKARQALRFAIRKDTRQQPRFADNGGIEAGKERKRFQNVVQRRYQNLSDVRPLPAGDLRQAYRTRLQFLRLPAAKQAKIRQDRQERKDIRQYLGSDETFQTQKDMLQKALSDYKLSNQGQRGRVREDFGLATDRMAQERTKGLGMMNEDFAARGILQSGELMKERTDYDTQYAQRLGDLSRDQGRSLEDLMEQMRLFRSDNQMQLQLAKQEAIRRRAAQQGIGLSNPAPRRRRKR